MTEEPEVPTPEHEIVLFVKESVKFVFSSYKQLTFASEHFSAKSHFFTVSGSIELLKLGTAMLTVDA